ncbi:MAG TPA: hypothetical protein DEP23_10810 [Ruminococcaceae bacterium]|nr:hypothetical protein [Oscillospiraceae bacterium]
MKMILNKLTAGVLLVSVMLSVSSCGKPNPDISEGGKQTTSQAESATDQTTTTTDIDSTTNGSTGISGSQADSSASSGMGTSSSAKSTASSVLSSKNKTTSASPSTTATKATSANQTTTTTKAPPSGTVMDFRKPGDTNTLGVWWWSISTIKGSTGQKYLDFCVLNSVSEIYLCIDGMSQSGSTNFADVRAFVKKASNMGIRVAALTGDYKWIQPGNNGFQNYVDKFVSYQNAAAADEKFYSMHLDVEPHQHPDFKTGTAGRAKIMQWFADFAINKAVPAAQSAGTLLEWDIPFWMSDTVKNPENGSNIILAELMAKHCDTITIMSYRDTAQAMHSVSAEEIAFAKKHGCKIVLGAETYSTEGDQVSFMEEGKAYMATELNKLNNMLLGEFADRNFGLAIHQIKRWFDLKN